MVAEWSSIATESSSAKGAHPIPLCTLGFILHAVSSLCAHAYCKFFILQIPTSRYLKVFTYVLGMCHHTGLLMRVFLFTIILNTFK